MRLSRLAALLLVLAPALARAAEFTRPVGPIPGLSAPLDPLAGGALKGPIGITPASPLVGPVLPLGALELPASLVPAEALIPRTPLTPAGVGAEIGPLSAPQAGFGARDRDAHEGGAWSRTYHSFQEWSDEFRKADAADQPGLVNRLFENDLAREAAGDVLPPVSAPKIPVGVRSVTVDAVTDALDIGRLIPRGVNSDALIDKLVENIDQMGQYRIYSYHANKGKFVGIDLSARPALVDLLPEQQSHEVRLIKKIQAYNQDLRVLVREDGKTPDLVVGGVVTELKSLIGDKVDLTYLVDKANTQVLEHATRHGLGNGAAVVDLAKESRVPVAAVLKEINAWARMPRGAAIAGGYLGPRHLKQDVSLDKITVFAGKDVKVFGRGKDGAYRVLDETPFADFTPSNPRRVSREQAPPVKRGQIADAFEKSRILSDLRGFYERGRLRRALKAWDKFVDTHERDMVRQAAPEAEVILAKVRRKLDSDRRYRRPNGRRR